jgi:hypothetical protein
MLGNPHFFKELLVLIFKRVLRTSSLLLIIFIKLQRIVQKINVLKFLSFFIMHKF